MKKGLSWVNKLIFLFNSICSFFLFFAYLSPYINPNYFWPAAFFGLAYPVLLLITILFGLYWLVLLKKQFLLSFITVLVGVYYLQYIINYNKNTPTSSNTIKGFKLLTYNVRLFDFYNWSKSWETKELMFKWLEGNNADITCYQEFLYFNDESEVFSTDSLLRNQKATNAHAEYTYKYSETYKSGIATFSIFKIINKETINFKKQKHNLAIATDILADNDTIRIYNVHLQSIHLNAYDYQYIEDLVSDKKHRTLTSSWMSILKKLREAFIIRANQAEAIKKHVLASPYPVIICGDFNDTPFSYAYHILSDGLNDAFIESGSGWGYTYNGILPFFKIDHILYSPSNFRVSDFAVERVLYSDHYPINCKFEILQKH